MCACCVCVAADGCEGARDDEHEGAVQARAAPCSGEGIHPVPQHAAAQRHPRRPGPHAHLRRQPSREPQNTPRQQDGEECAGH